MKLVIRVDGNTTPDDALLLRDQCFAAVEGVVAENADRFDGESVVDWEVGYGS